MCVCFQLCRLLWLLQQNNYFCAKYLGNKINKRQHKWNVNMEQVSMRKKQPGEEGRGCSGFLHLANPQGAKKASSSTLFSRERRVSARISTRKHHRGFSMRVNGWGWWASRGSSLTCHEQTPCWGRMWCCLKPRKAVFGPSLHAHSLSDLEQVISLLCTPGTHF